MNATGSDSRRALVIARRLVACLLLACCSALWADSGARLDPFLQGCDSAEGCAAASVSLSTIKERCSDEDGCTVRLTYVTLGNTGVGGVALFGLNDNGTGWNLTVDSSSYILGQNKDGDFETVLSVNFGLFGACAFLDDTSARPTNGTFELVTTPDFAGTVTCYVRIDD